MSHRVANANQYAAPMRTPLSLLCPEGGDSCGRKEWWLIAVLKHSVCGEDVGLCPPKGVNLVEVYDIFKLVYLAGLIVATAYGVFKEIEWFRRFRK